MTSRRWSCRTCAGATWWSARSGWTASSRGSTRGTCCRGGVFVDLTREQFRLGQTVTAGRVMGKRPAGRLPRRWEEYQVLRRRVFERLGL
ncbi:YunG family protein [Streptomyces goshikiensis]